MDRTRFASSILLPVMCAAVSLAQDARQIISEAQKRSSASSVKYQGLLQVIDGKQTAQKRWQYERLGSYGSAKSILRFTAPPEVKGVALLVVNHSDRAADQWMWTPAIGRERRIALQDRSTRFFGTDFSFEDLEERDVDQFDYKLVGEDTVDGAKCWRIECLPRKGKSSQYSKLEIWVRQDHYVNAKMEAFVKDQVVRRLKFQQIAEVQGIWTAHVLEMEDLKRKSRTVLKLEQLQYNVPMKPEQFTVAALQQ